MPSFVSRHAVTVILSNQAVQRYPSPMGDHSSSESLFLGQGFMAILGGG
jgi:hypothetical protein